MRLTLFLTALLPVVVPPIVASRAVAQNYPAKSVRVVNPYAAGGGLDAIFRPVMVRVTENVGQTFVIDNRAGAGGIIGTDIVSKAAPDGYALLVMGIPVWLTPFLQDNVRRSKGLGNLAGELVKVAGRDVVKVAREHLSHLAGGRMVDKLNDVLQQRYSGDVTLSPQQSPRQLMRMLANPSAADIAQYIRDGERATWPKLERIRMQTRISRAFEDCLQWLKDHGEERQLARLRPKLRAARRPMTGAGLSPPS